MEAPASNAGQVVDALFYGRMSAAQLAAWLSENGRVINMTIFDHPRLNALNAWQLALIRAVAPEGVFTPLTKEIYLQVREPEDLSLANALFQQFDSDFLSALIDLGFSNGQVSALGSLCKQAYQRHLRAPDSIVEGINY